MQNHETVKDLKYLTQCVLNKYLLNRSIWSTSELKTSPHQTPAAQFHQICMIISFLAHSITNINLAPSSITPTDILRRKYNISEVIFFWNNKCYKLTLLRWFNKAGWE